MCVCTRKRGSQGGREVKMRGLEHDLEFKVNLPTFPLNELEIRLAFESTVLTLNFSS